MPPLGLYPWTPLAEFRPHTFNLPTTGKKILRAPMGKRLQRLFDVESFRYT